MKSLFRQTPITACLIISIVAYFILQLMMGVNIESPTNADLVRFGANFLPYSASTQPWRLLVAGFVHIGFIHLLFNGFALYYFGQALEVLIGKWRFLALFMLSVVGGNLLSLYYTWYL